MNHLSAVPMMGATDYSSLEFSEVSSHYESSLEDDDEKVPNEEEDKKSAEQNDSQNSVTPFDEFNTPASPDKVSKQNHYQESSMT